MPPGLKKHRSPRVAVEPSATVKWKSTDDGSSGISASSGSGGTPSATRKAKGSGLSPSTTSVSTPSVCSNPTNDSEAAPVSSTARLKVRAAPGTAPAMA